MADFRKVFVLAMLALVVGVGVASAQSAVGPFTCTANAAVPPTVRSEGNTELVGDIVVDCTGGIPTPAPVGSGISNVPQVNFTVFLNTNITSRIYDTTGTSEALMIIDEPLTTTNPLGLFPCLTVGTTGLPTSTSTPATNGCTFPGTSTVAGVAGPGQLYGSTYVVGTTTYTRPNVYRGIVSGNQVQFIGVPVDAPGTAGHRVFRITNVRANAAGISAGASGTPGTLQALISATGSTSVPIQNPTQVVGFVQSGMTFNMKQRGDILTTPNTTTDIANPQCNGVSRTTSNNSAQKLLQFTENFPTAFKIRGANSGVPVTPGVLPSGSQNIPGSIYNTESGFYSLSGIGTGVGALPLNTGLADYGTRLKAVFNNIPAGVSVYVSTTSVANNGTATVPSLIQAVLLSGAIGIVGPAPAQFSDMTCTYCSGFPQVSTGSNTAVQLSVVNGSASAVWEVTQANSLSADNYFFMVYFAYSANPGSNSPAPGTTTVTGGFAPTPTDQGVSASTASSASQTLGIPRFIEGTQTRAASTIYTCRTNLLFPFVTNQAGFDTGLAISNTSQDPFGTTVQNGSCTLFSYGDNAPASIPTGPINGGKTYVTLASTAMPNFQGYVIAQCAFQFAHGFAFVSDFGARNLAMGYLALVIPEPGAGSRGANPLSAGGTGSGEALGN